MLLRATYRSGVDLSGQASPAGHRFTNLVRLDAVDSTNTYVTNTFANGASEGLVCVADEQLAGRGRRGRQWHAPSGSALLFSVLFQPSFPIERFHLVTSAFALATRAAVKSVSGLTVSLKWPNDLLVGEKKLGGILAELVNPVVSGEPAGLVVGLGLNISWPPGYPPENAPKELFEALARATTLEESCGRPIERDVLLDALLVALEPRYAGLSGPSGTRALLEEYRAACQTIGERVQLFFSASSEEGEVLDVADDGRLVVRFADRVQAIDTADVVHLRPSSPMA